MNKGTHVQRKTQIFAPKKFLFCFPLSKLCNFITSQLHKSQHNPLTILMLLQCILQNRI